MPSRARGWATILSVVAAALVSWLAILAALGLLG